MNIITYTLSYLDYECLIHNNSMIKNNFKLKLQETCFSFSHFHNLYYDNKSLILIKDLIKLTFFIKQYKK